MNKKPLRKSGVVFLYIPNTTTILLFPAFPQKLR